MRRFVGFFIFSIISLNSVVFAATASREKQTQVLKQLLAIAEEAKGDYTQLSKKIDALPADPSGGTDPGRRSACIGLVMDSIKVSQKFNMAIYNASTWLSLDKFQAPILGQPVDHACMKSSVAETLALVGTLGEFTAKLKADSRLH